PTVTVNPVTLGAGTALASFGQLTGTATATVNGQVINVPGTFSYTTATGTLLPAGSSVIEDVTFYPSPDTATFGPPLFNSVQTTVTVNVKPAGTIQVAPQGLTLGRTAVGLAGPTTTYSVSASNLTAPLSITAPAGVELSTDGKTFSTSLALTPTSAGF